MQILEGQGVPVHALLFTPDGGSLLSAGDDGSLSSWGAWGDRTELGRRALPIYSLACSADGQWLATGSKDGTLELWDLPGRQVKATRPACGRAATGLAFLHDNATVAYALGRHLQSADEAPGVHLWDWRESTKRDLPVNVAQFTSIRALASLPGKRLLAWATDIRTIIVWNLLHSNRIPFNLKNACKAIAFAPDGKTLAAAVDWKVILFDLERRQEKSTLAGHKGPVSSLSFSPDGRHLLTGSWDKMVKFWDLRSGREFASYEWPVGRISAAGFAPDGLRAAAAGDSGTIAIWDVDS